MNFTQKKKISDPQIDQPKQQIELQNKLRLILFQKPKPMSSKSNPKNIKIWDFEFTVFDNEEHKITVFFKIFTEIVHKKFLPSSDTIC